MTRVSTFIKLFEDDNQMEWSFQIIDHIPSLPTPENTRMMSDWSEASTVTIPYDNDCGDDPFEMELPPPPPPSPALPDLTHNEKLLRYLRPVIQHIVPDLMIPHLSYDYIVIGRSPNEHKTTIYDLINQFSTQEHGIWLTASEIFRVVFLRFAHQSFCQSAILLDLTEPRNDRKRFYNLKTLQNHYLYEHETESFLTDFYDALGSAFSFLPFCITKKNSETGEKHEVPYLWNIIAGAAYSFIIPFPIHSDHIVPEQSEPVIEVVE